MSCYLRLVLPDNRNGLTFDCFWEIRGLGSILKFLSSHKIFHGKDRTLFCVYVPHGRNPTNIWSRPEMGVTREMTFPFRTSFFLNCSCSVLRYLKKIPAVLAIVLITVFALFSKFFTGILLILWYYIMSIFQQMPLIRFGLIYVNRKLYRSCNESHQMKIQGRLIFL